MRIKNIVGIALVTALLLLVPLVAMQFNDEVDWGLADFVGAGVLLFGTGLTYELIASRSGTIAYRVAAGVALAASLLLVWVNLAVGLIGNEDNPVNVLYGGVLVVGFLGAIIAGLQPHGMARALFAMALAQVSVPVIALTVWKPPVGSLGVNELGANAFFVTLFVGSALLFQRAARTQPGSPVADDLRA